MKKDTHIVIMAGGTGSRLWPVSTPARPKQFIDLLGVGKSLIQLTVDRFRPVSDNFWVVTSAAYKDIVAEQIPDIPAERILCEPVGRNTAPCIAYACTKIQARYPEANIVVTPSDAIVLDTAKFAANIEKAVEAVSGSDKIVTIGITPSTPSTGYGYICAESTERDKVVKVSSFREKPDLATAKEYLAAGNYLWNAGIFIWNVATAISELRAHAPSIMDVMDRLTPSFYTENEDAALAELFPQCEKISIDYAVMEKSPSIYTIASDLGWSDLGTYASLSGYIEADPDGNRVVGSDVRLFGCNGCIVQGGNGKTIVASGLDGYIIAAQGDSFLVCPVSEEQHIKEYSEKH